MSRFRLLLGVVVAGLLLTVSPSSQAAPVEQPTRQIAQAQSVQLQAAKGCGDWRSAVATIGKWSRAYKSDCAVLGSKGWRVGYSWVISPTSESRICVQGRGYVLRDGIRRAKWFGLGCGTDNSYCTTGPRCSVPWGKAAALPAVRAKAQPGFLGAGFRWRH
jgi:hypothetical protein